MNQMPAYGILEGLNGLHCLIIVVLMLLVVLAVSNLMAVPNE